MAMSNWDLLAFNQLAQPCDGEFKNSHGNSVEIYKNFLYLKSPKMWTPDGASFTEPTIAQMGEGNLNIAGFDITATRGPQNAVFCIVTSYLNTTDYQRKIEGGIGCSGYENDVEIVLTRLGRTSEINGNWCAGWSSEGGNVITNLDTGEEVFHDYETEYVGVKSSTLEAFCKWAESLDDEDIKKWVAKVRETTPQRFNQGDMFFSENLNVDLSPSEPGLASDPLISKILKPSSEE